MFGKFGDMMGKLQEMKQKADEIKKKLEDTVIHSGTVDGNIKIEITGNRKIRSIEIPELLMQGTKEDLEASLSAAVNRAIEAADKANDEEMKKAASGLLPGI
jgi:DNA-binding YbaB/EbfC family protein